MKVEVPSVKYDAAVKSMENRIKNGQVPGVADPSEAKNIIRKGHFTYEQAKNIARAGTVESITFDAVNGTIIATTAFGVSAILTFATNIWNGEDFNTALKSATYSGLKVGGTTFVTAVLSSQLSKVGLNSALVGSSEALVNIIGPKASTVTGGTAGWVGGATAGAAVGSVVPIIGTAVGGVLGGLLGSFAGGSTANKVSNSIVSKFIEDDADEMVSIIEKVFTQIAEDYLLNQKEAENIIDNLKDELSGSTLKNMFASSDRRKFANNLLINHVESEGSKRKKIFMPSQEEMQNGLRSVLEEISDNMALT